MSTPKPKLPPINHLINQYNAVFEKLKQRLKKRGVLSSREIRSYAVDIGGAWLLHDFAVWNGADMSQVWRANPKVYDLGSRQPLHELYSEKLLNFYRHNIAIELTIATKDKRYYNWITTGYRGSLCKYKAQYPKAIFKDQPPAANMVCPAVDKRLQGWKLQAVQ